MEKDKISPEKKQNSFCFTHGNPIALQKVFMPLLIWFQVFGIEIFDFSSQKFCRVLSKFPKYAFAFLSVMIFLDEIMTLVISYEKRVSITALVSLVLTFSSIQSLHRNRQRFAGLFSRLSGLSNQLNTHAFLKRMKRLVYLQCFLFSIGMGIESAITFTFMAQSPVVTQLNDEGEEVPHKNILSYATFSKFIQAVYAKMLFVLLCNICVHYCSLCEIIANIFQQIKFRIKSIPMEAECRALIEIHRESTDTMMLMDDLYCFVIFSIVFNNMTALFWSGYLYAFTPHPSHDELWICAITGIINFLSLLRIVVAASLASEAALESQNAVMSLPGFIPSQHKVLKNLLFQNQNRYKRMTLWDMYDFKRSLFITIIANLLTYGIIFGTLGKSQ